MLIALQISQFLVAAALLGVLLRNYSASNKKALMCLAFLFPAVMSLLHLGYTVLPSSELNIETIKLTIVSNLVSLGAVMCILLYYTFKDSVNATALRWYVLTVVFVTISLPLVLSVSNFYIVVMTFIQGEPVITLFSFESTLKWLGEKIVLAGFLSLVVGGFSGLLKPIK